MNKALKVYSIIISIVAVILLIIVISTSVCYQKNINNVTNNANEIEQELENTKDRLDVYEELLVDANGNPTDPFVYQLARLKPSIDEKNGLHHNILYPVVMFTENEDPSKSMIMVESEGERIETSLAEMDIVSVNNLMD